MNYERSGPLFGKIEEQRGWNCEEPNSSNLEYLDLFLETWEKLSVNLELVVGLFFIIIYSCLVCVGISFLFERDLYIDY